MRFLLQVKIVPDLFLSRMDPLLVPWEKPLQHVSTLVRQFLIDFIIITGLLLVSFRLWFAGNFKTCSFFIEHVFDIYFSENCVLLGIALNSNITELRENQVPSLLFSHPRSSVIYRLLSGGVHSGAFGLPPGGADSQVCLLQVSCFFKHLQKKLSYLSRPSPPNWCYQRLIKVD